MNPVVVRDLLALRVEHVPVTVPDLRAGRAFALLDDLAERVERRREVLHSDHPATASAQVGIADLTSGVAAEDGVLPSVAHRPLRPFSIAA